jgi:hypothetical protein
MNKRQDILNIIHDMVSNFLYYDRKDDEDLKDGDVQENITAGNITIEEIVEEFEKCLRKELMEKE